MTRDRNDIWFPAKKVGFGWGLPVAWQGWVVLAVYLLAVTGGTALLVRTPYRTVALPLYVGAMTAGFIFICWKKGERLEWRR